MNRFRPALAISLLALVLPSLAFADDKTSDEALRIRGLTKVGIYYLLDEDIKLPEFLRVARAAEAKVETSLRKRAYIQKDINIAQNSMEGLESQNEALTAKLQKTSKEAFGTYNHYVDQVNSVRSQLRDGQKYIERRQKDLAEVGDPSDEYVTLVMKLSETMEGVTAKYAKLAADDDVQEALNRINQAAPMKVKLGPSVRFTMELPNVRKLRETISSAAIKVDMRRGVPETEVILNGTLRITMIVDSGASAVSLTSDVAKKIGLVPGPNDRIVQAVSADGKKTPVHVMKIKSVRVGPFTAENVECFVQPPSITGADCLLGDTFLRNFVYKMDLASGYLKLSQVNGKPATEPPAITATTPTSAPPTVVTPKPPASDLPAILAAAEPASDPANRAVPPDDVALMTSRGLVHELFADEFADTTPKARGRLATKLLARGLATTDDSVGRYALLREACDAAATAGDLTTALRATTEIGRLYQINTLQSKAAVMAQFTSKLAQPPDAALIAAHGLVLLEGMVQRALYFDAGRLLPLVRDAIAASKDASIGSAVKARFAAVESTCAEFDAAKAAHDKLKSTPDDPAANLAVGRFFCFYHGGFDAGLPLLAKGSDAALKSLAAADLTNPTTPSARKQAGDAWWDQSAKEHPPAAAACKARAAYWYRLAEPQLEGLERMLIQKRLGSI